VTAVHAGERYPFVRGAPASLPAPPAAVAARAQSRGVRAPERFEGQGECESYTAVVACSFDRPLSTTNIFEG
jgi:hypothetical protein